RAVRRSAGRSPVRGTDPSRGPSARPGEPPRRAACRSVRPSPTAPGTMPTATLLASAESIPGMLPLCSFSVLDAPSEAPSHAPLNYCRKAPGPAMRAERSQAMLTPAEELGLSGLALAGRVQKAFHRIPEPELIQLMRRIREESFGRHLIYLRHGEPDAIRILPCPVTALPDQLAYIHYVPQTILNALKRLPELYFQDFAVRDLLRLSADEERWLWECWGPSQREHNPVFGRLDAMVDFISPMWKDSLRFVEPNLSG